MKLTQNEQTELLKILHTRFKKYPNRHKNIAWEKVAEKLENNSKKLWSLQKMEDTGGEPDLVEFNKKSDTFIFMDCSAESPKGRRSICYDRKGLESRKEHKPKNNAIDMAAEMGVSLLTETDYRKLQELGDFDTKTSSWIETPAAIRTLGGAIFGDFRFGTVFIYHNGAQSYYAGRGFRGKLKI